MEVPAFSIFSAISEVFVTLAVLYTIISNLRGDPFRWKLMGLVLAFELCVNIVYMVGRSSGVDASTEISSGMKLFFAGHGILSLGMFVALVIVYIVSVMDMKEGEQTWFQRHRIASYVIIAFWMVSVTSGEALFFIRYGGALGF